ncbi:STM2901 family protein [Rahnella aceris]|uniref:STM2901 family protein n=1 Tax=Rahnella sp. (strain Y9602) TaxID=2703885 RepID=UPI003FD247BF
MDTIEELNVTYFYHGHANLSNQELFGLIFIESLSNHLGLDTTATVLIITGQPYIPVPGKMVTAIPGTSVALKLSRALLKQAKLPFGLKAWTPVGKSFNTLTMRKTTKWAALIDRYVPFVGYAMAVILIQQVAAETRSKYNLIARPEDRIAWTYF